MFREKTRFEITDDQSDRTKAHNQTSSVTVYGFYLQESPTDLTIIDTPGYGDTRGIELDQEIAVSLYNLSDSAEGIYEIDAVCLVIKATQHKTNSLTDKSTYLMLFSLYLEEILLKTLSCSSHTQLELHLKLP